ncbi:toxic anion resistance protein [Lysinibacillus sp. Ag94]|uniref:toxic anion resistance protein n=1 Tax=Lysinibacillus sp. Ag94 TaxID=2936682 RepID=UPI00200C1999|nr:toxic anion resistance protein [Lysinibacillus sp. Ag94]UPW85243.1 toxic anion resistance protein [Lysinibacillus sp. Ag94]
MTANDHAFQLNTIQGLSPLVQSYLETTPNNEAMATYDTLSPLAQSRALLYASQLDLTNFESVLSLGQDSQRSLSQFADRMLAQVKQKDVTKIGQMLDSLMQTLDRVDPNALEPKKQSFFKKMFGKIEPTVKQTLTEFERISIQVERIGVQLERAQLQMLRDVEMLEGLYAHNRGFFEELATAIAAGQMKKQQAIEVELPEKVTSVQATKQPLAIQQLNDFAAQIERLDQRIYDLQVSQQVALQTAPQIRMIQQSNQTLAEKIEFSIVTLIPLWKNQLAMMLSMHMDHHYAQLEERLSRTNDRFTSPSFEQQVSKFKETQHELKTAIKDVFALHTATEQEKQQLQDVAELKTFKKE